MSFDDFGWTDEFNPWGIVPGISLAREADPADGALRENGGEGDGMGDGMGGDGGGGNRRYKRSRDNYTPHPLGDRYYRGHRQECTSHAKYFRNPDISDKKTFKNDNSEQVFDSSNQEKFKQISGFYIFLKWK